MPQLSFASRRGPSAWFRFVLCQLLPAWCGLLMFAGSAAAMSGPLTNSPGTDEPAPMCDPDGASVAARDDIPEVDRGRFEALPCEAQLLMAGWRPDAPEFGSKATVRDAEQSAPAHHAEVPRPRCDGTSALGVPFPAPSESVLGEYAAGEGLAPSQGHDRSLFRPPVA